MPASDSSVVEIPVASSKQQAASSKRRVTAWRHAPGCRIRAVVARLLHWSSRLPWPRSVDSDSSYQSTFRQAFLQMSTSEDGRDAALANLRGVQTPELGTARHTRCTDGHEYGNENFVNESSKSFSCCLFEYVVLLQSLVFFQRPVKFCAKISQLSINVTLKSRKYYYKQG